MATNAEITAAGYVLPVSTDMVTNGDDAINANARASYEDVRAAEARAKDYAQAKPAPIPTSHDFATMQLPAGRWSISSQARLDYLTNAPAWMTSGDVIDALPGVGFEMAYSYRSGTVPELYYRGRLGAGATAGWSPWTRIPTPADPAAARYAAGYGAMGHETRAGFALRRLGGSIGTAGRAAVALRFDDNPAAFRDKVLPVLRRLQLPGYIASATRYYAETAVAYADVQAWAVNDGVGIANHTATHADSTTDAAIWDNTVGAADALEAAMPAVLVDVWTMPSVGGTKMAGYDDGRYVADFLDTTAGHAIASRHAVVNGYSGGRWQPLIGRPAFGQTHLTIEAMTEAQAKAYVDEAVHAGVGLTLMLHPSRLDTAGSMTTATFTAVLEYIAQLRDAGRLLALSPLALGYADASHGHRLNLLPAGAFPNGTTSAVSTATVALSPFLSMRGAQLELVARVSGAAGDVVRLAVAQAAVGLNATVDHTLPAAGWHEVRKLLTLPATAAYDSSLSVSVGRVSGSASLQLRDVRLQAV